MNYNVFDIETGPLPIEHLEDMMPQFFAPSNWKDEGKIEAKIKEQQVKWFEKAALDARTGQVLAIGIKNEDGLTVIQDQHNLSEKELLQWFWDQSTNDHTRKWVGFNSHGFDLPFLFRRSLVHGVTIGTPMRENRYWPNKFTDLMEVWCCGNREQRISLDKLCTMLGIGGKSGSGAHFASLFISNPKAAIDYLKHDLDLTDAVLQKMLPWISGGHDE